MNMVPSLVDATMASRFFAEFFKVSQAIAEVRILNAVNIKGIIQPDGGDFRPTIAGYFDRTERVLEYLKRVRNLSVYVGSNPVDPSFRASQGFDTLRKAGRDELTSGNQVPLYYNVFLDYDAPRVSKQVSATQEELQRCLEARDRFLDAHPEIIAASIWGCSGNGGWSWTNLGGLPNNQENRAKVAQFRKTVKRMCPTIEIDATDDPSRIMPIPGTMKCKGLNTSQWPWRPATIDSPEGHVRNVFDLDGWLSEWDRPGLSDPGAAHGGAYGGIQGATHGTKQPLLGYPVGGGGGGGANSHGHSHSHNHGLIGVNGGPIQANGINGATQGIIGPTTQGIISPTNPYPWSKEPLAYQLEPLHEESPEVYELASRKTRDTVIKWAHQYVGAMPEAISGQGGHKQTFDVACVLIKGYSLDRFDAYSILESYNTRCQPPWTPGELEHKIQSAQDKADDKSRGYLIRKRVANELNRQRANQIPMLATAPELIATDADGRVMEVIPTPLNGSPRNVVDSSQKSNGKPIKGQSTTTQNSFTQQITSQQTTNQQISNPSPVDLASFHTKVDALVAANQIEDFYRGTDFFQLLLLVEVHHKAEYLIARTKLRKIKGNTNARMDEILEQYRPPKITREVARDATPRPPREVVARPHDVPGDDDFPLTDVGNGLRMIATFGHQVRYSKSQGDWLIYDGRRWALDHGMMIELFSQQIPNRIIENAPRDESGDPDPTYQRWAFKSQAKERIAAMIHCARPMVSVLPENLDCDPWLLNVQNGTINLKDGTIRAHSPSDLITKVANAKFDPEAKCPRWDQFVFEIMDNDHSRADYLRRAVGYSITGVIREHVLFFLSGNGRNGKTTWLNSIFSVLGDYANQIDSELIMEQKYAQHPTGLTELEGRRFISADESDEGRKMAESEVKRLTGDNNIQARRMNQNFYTFRPTHHLFYASNHKPDIRGTDAGIWRRIKLIEFKACYDLAIAGGTAPDLNLKETLLEESSGILNWMIKGCLEWQKQGLGEPKVIADAVNSYRSEMDMLGTYLDECIQDRRGETDPDSYRLVFSDLYWNYQQWCKTMNTSPLGPRKFTNQLESRGYSTQKSNSVTYKVGLSFRSHEQLIFNNGMIE